MNLKKQFSVILTLAVAFMMLVVPLSTALGGGDQEYSKSSLNIGEGTDITADTIPKIPSKTILYQTSSDNNLSTDPAYKSYNFNFTSDSTVVQMIPYAWNTLSNITNTSYSGSVFNGWNVTYKTGSDDKYGIYVTKNDGTGTDPYIYSAEPFRGNTTTSVLCRIMPGDGIVFGSTVSYDPTYGVLTLPSNAENITFTAKWDSPHIVEVTQGWLGWDWDWNSAYSRFDTYNPISGKGSIFTSIIWVPSNCSYDQHYSYNAEPATILGSSDDITLSLNTEELTADTYFEKVKLSKSGNLNTSSRFIAGENVTIINNGGEDWYGSVNNYTPNSGYLSIYASGSGSASHLVILGGTYGIISSSPDLNKDSYVSVGPMTGTEGPKIALLYGGNESSHSGVLNSHIVVNNGIIIELLGGNRYANSISSNIEVRGGYVSYLTGGPRQGDAVVGGGSGTAVKIFVSGGIVDYLFSGAKDGNYKDKNLAPVHGNVEIKVSGGHIYGLFGGGYDFWAKTLYNGVIGNIDILITGGSIGNDTSIVWMNLGNSVGKKPTDYYSIDPGVYGGGYRGSVLGNVTIKIGMPAGASDAPIVYGNVYGGGSGGPDYSLMYNSSGRGEGHDDTTGQSYVGSSTSPKDVKVTIGTAKITGDVYGGGKGVAKSSYVKTMYAYGGGTTIGIFTDLDTSVYDVATVFGNTIVQIQNNAVINGNVFGAGKGVSKSVWIGNDTTQNPSGIISSRLYNMADSKNTLGISIAKYQWQHCNGKGTTFSDIPDANDSSYSISYPYNSGYIRLKMTVVDTREVIYSNAVEVTETSIYSPLSIKNWESWNTELTQIAAVSNNSTVNIQSGTINGSVYGGGSYGVVGNVIYVDDTATSLHRHELSGGTTNVNIQSGTINGSVYGGGMGEPDTVTTGSVGLSSSVVIGNNDHYPTISKNIYGGGENGFVGGAFIAIHFDNTTSKEPSMLPLNINGHDTNTYYFVIDVAYSDNNNESEALGTSKVNIHNLNNLESSTNTNIYGGGYGVNATVTGSTDVTIAGGHVYSVYGGGELGMVGKLTGQGTGSTLHLDGGSTAVNIIGTTIESDATTKVIIEDSVFGGGKGQYTTSADEIILGSVGEKTSVLIESKTLRGVVIKGGVLGGGKLGLVGSYTVSEKNGDGTGGDKLEFKGGSTNVKITGGLVCDDVFGGGMGSPYNTLSGAVGKTQVIISGITSVDEHNKRGGLTSTTTQIGVGPNDLSPLGMSSLNQSVNTNTENNSNDSNSSGILSASEEPVVETNVIPPLTDFGGAAAGEGKMLIAIAKPNYGTITVSETIGSTNTVLNAVDTATQDGAKKFSYSIYLVTENSTLRLTYSDSNKRYSPDWYGYTNSSTASTKLNDASGDTLTYTVSSNKSTIYAVENDLYNTSISIAKPSQGQINVLLNGQKIAPYDDTDTEYIFAAPVGETLNLIYEAPANSGHYVTKWSGTTPSDKDTAALTVPAKGMPVNVSVQLSNEYTITVEKPTNGTINVYDLTAAINAGGSDIDKILIDGLTPLNAKSVNDTLSTYNVSFGTKLMLEYKPALIDNKPESAETFVKKWNSNPLLNMSQAADDPNIAVMIVAGNTTLSVSEGSSIGNVYGGGAYGLVGNVTLDLSRGENGLHPIVGSDNNAVVEVIILGGKIGTDNPGSISTGNVFGGGYGPNATVAGSTHVYIGSVPAMTGIKTDPSHLEITDSVYGGGEMGSIGAAGSDGNLFSSGTYTPEISSNVSICQSENKSENNYVIIIGKPIYKSQLPDTPVELIGNVFGGGQGGDIPELVLMNTLPDGENVNAENVTRNGYAVVHGTTNVVISGMEDGKSNLGNIDSNIRIGSSVYGGGEGIIKGQSRLTAGTSAAEAILESAEYGRVAGGTSSVASRVYINDAVVTESVFGGGKLGILGNFNKTTGEYSGKDSIVYISGFVRSNIFGGGEGHADSAVSGAVGNSLVIIGGNAEIGSNDGIHIVPGPDGLDISGGNVYGGGRLSIIGDNVLVNKTSPGNLTKQSKDNASETNIVILGGKILNSVYGGGFSPKATIAGSTHIYVGDAYNNIKNNSNLISNHALCNQLNNFFSAVNKILIQSSADIETGDGITIGNIYGGGEMGSVGSTTLVKEDTENQLDPSLKNDTNDDGMTDENDGWVSANISINSSSTKVTIGINNEAFKAATGNIYGGGKGVLNSVIHNIPGYAIIRGNTSVSIEGNADKTSVSVLGNVFGGGEGVISDVASIRYAEVYDYTEVSVKNVLIKGNVYGGSSYGVVGHFVDSQPANGEITITQHDEDGNVILITGTVSIDEATKKVTITYKDESGTEQTIKNLDVTNREFCGDDVQFDITSNKFKKGPKAYNGMGTAKVSVYDANVDGNVFGGGKGAKTNILAGAVGRGTEVNIEVSPTGPGGTITSIDNNKTIIGNDADGGNVYGGGEYGIVGSVVTQIIGTGSFSPVKVLHASHVSDLDVFPINSDYSSYNFNTGNDIDLVVNIFGGTINGSVFGAGKGEEIRLEGVNYKGLTVSYYKLSSFGRTEVNVSNGVIKSSVYGGSQNGETGSFTVLQRAHQFTDGYWKFMNTPYAPPSNVPSDVRDNGYIDSEGKLVEADLTNFSAAFVNVIGGTIDGSVFGGGYFGAVYGTCHVHMGWNSVMPDPDNSLDKGDCHYYNNYDSNYGGKDLPFNVENKKTLISNLFINGSVYAGGDRGVPDGEVNYNFITIYGNSHILLNGTNYAAGTDKITAPEKQIAAMYVRGSLFGSGNSCSAFYDEGESSHFITIKNYQAVTEGTSFSLNSIQRASSVTLINSKLRLIGRSDGANANPTALYSLNYIYKLTLQSSNEGSSQIILDAPTKDLREIRSQTYDGTTSKYVDTILDNPYNTIQLNGGIVLEVKKDSGDPGSDFGPVNGYFNLDVDLLSYYNAYVYGQIQMEGNDHSAKGGFVYGNSFYGVRFGEIPHVDSRIPTDIADNLKTGYRAWLPVGGGGHLTASSTVVATNTTETSDPSDSGKTAYLNTGDITLPMTGAGSKYKLIGYNIYPSQIAKLGDDNKSLKLVSGETLKAGDENGFTGTNNNTAFKLKISVGNGFIQEGGKETPYFWFIDNGTVNDANDVWTLKTSGGVLPTFNLELYSQGVTKTTVAGNIMLTIQEEKPTGTYDENGAEIYSPGDEININITIETQADAFGDEVTDNNSDRYNKDELKTHINYEDKTTLYVNSTGKYSLQYIIPPIGNAAYNLTLKNVKLTPADLGSTFTLVSSLDDIDDKNQYAISIKANDVKNREGWNNKGSISSETFLTVNSEGNLTNDISIGTTDGRYQAGILITLYSKADPAASKPEGYPAGTITFEIDYAKSGEVNAELSDSNNDSGRTISVQPESGKIFIDNNISTQLEIYTVSFVPGVGVTSIPSKQVNSGETLSNDNTDFVKDLIDHPPQKEGMTFKAWRELIGYDIDENGNYIPKLDPDVDAFNLSGTPIIKNTTLYAVYTYAVIFHFGYNNKDGNEYVATLPVGGAGTISSNPDYATLDTTRTGYTFAGWYTDKAFTAKFNDASAIEKSIDVYAKWDPVDYTIHFDKNSTESVSMPENIPNCTLDAPNIDLTKSRPVSAPPGKSFGGWSAKNDATSGVLSSIDLNDCIDNANEKNIITLYAVWTTNPVVDVTLDKSAKADLSYSINDGASWTPFTNSFSVVEHDKTVKIKCNLTESGRYNITDATLDSNPQDKLSVSSDNIFSIGAVKDNTSVTIHLTGQEHTVTLDALKNPDGVISGLSGSESSITVTYGEKFTELFLDNGEYKITATREGYEFKGWYLKNNPTNKLITSEDIVNITSGDEILVALYTPTSYDVTLTTGSNVSVLINGKTYFENLTNELGKIASQNTELQFSVFIPKGYTQTNINEILTIKMGTDSDAASQLALTDYSIGIGDPSADSITYTVTIKPNVINSNLFIILGNATLNKYIISGTVTDNASPAVKLPYVSEGITYTYSSSSMGTALGYVDIDTDGRYSIKSIYDGATISISVTLWGYAVYSKDLGIITDNNTNENIVLTKNLNVIYNLNGGSGSPPTDTAKYGPNDTITLNRGNEITRTGYTFEGWAVDKDGTVISNSYNINQEDFNGSTITFYAVWSAKTYTVKYDANGGTGTIAEAEATYDSPFTFSDRTGFTRENYTLTRWNTEADGSGTPYELNDTITWTIDADLTVYAVWELKTYTVKVTDILNKDERIVTSDYNAYIFAATGSSISDPKESDALKLNELQSGGYDRSGVPAGTYNIYFNLKSSDDPNGSIPLSYLAKLKETLEVGEGKDNSVAVQLWSIDFKFGISCDKESYSNMKNDRLLVVDEALPYQYNPFLIDEDFKPIPSNEWILPTLNDHYFVGWYTDPEGNNPWDSSIPVTKQVTVYAKWVKQELTINFNDGSSSIYDGKDLASALGAISSITMKKTYRVGDAYLEPLTETVINPTFSWFSWTENKNPTTDVKNAGTYTLTLIGTSPKYVPTITLVENKSYMDPDDPDNLISIPSGIYYVAIAESTSETNEFSGSADYTIKPLPITITPDKDQWKYYGDDLGHIYTGSNNTTTPNKNGIRYKVTADPDDNGTYDIITPGTGGYSELVGDLGLTGIDNIVFANVHADNYTISQGTLVNNKGDDKNPNYKISLSESPVSFEIKKLPIIVKPDEGQWKYYGDSLDQIHTSIDSSIKDFNEIQSTISAVINGTECIEFTPYSGDYVNYAELTNLVIVAASNDAELDQYADIGNSYSFIIKDNAAANSANSNYEITLDATGKTFEVKTLPITIKPDEGWWKFYGDPDDQIYNGTYTSSSSHKPKIPYTISAKINGTYTEYMTPSYWTTDYAKPGQYNDLSNINISYASAEQFKTAGEYNTVFSSSSEINGSNPNYEISLFGDKTGETNIQFTVKPLPVVIIPLDGQYRYYTADDDYKIYYTGADDNPVEISGKQLSYEVFDFRDESRSINLRNTPDFA